MQSIFGAVICLVAAILFIGMIFLATSIRIVQEDKRLSVYRLGRYLGDKGPGVVILIPIIDRGVVKDVGGVEKIPGLRFSGAIGETRTPVYADGKVFLAGEEWDAIVAVPFQRVSACA